MSSLAEILAAATRHYQSGRRDLAIERLGQAISLRPNIPEVHNNLGVVLAQEGRLAEAVASFQVAIRLKPDYADARNNLANALRELGSPKEIAGHLQEALRLRPDSAAKPADVKPDDAEVQFNLGLALAKQGKFQEAAANYQQALRLKPDFAGAHNNLGNVFVLQGKLSEAVASYRQGIRCQPDFANLHFNLGTALQEMGQLEEAVSSLREALRLNPDYAEGQFNLGVVLGKQGKPAEAEASLQQAVRLKPDYAEAHFNLGVVLGKQGKLSEAVASYRQAVRLKPDFAAAHCNLGNALREGHPEEALASLREALRLRPDFAEAHSNVILSLHYLPGSDAAAIHEECRRWNQQHAKPLKKFIQPHGNLPDPERRLRIGYASPHLGNHVSSFFTIPLLSNHHHRHYEIYCYEGETLPDATTERHRGYADVWRSTVGLSDQQVADLVRSDRIDILVDLAMHTANNRLLMFARKPAPVQVCWLAYTGTTGLSAIDYRLTDPYLDPPGLFDAFYAEESVRLPETFWCYDPLTDRPPVNALPGKADGVITFGCLNYYPKVNDDCLALWAQALRAVPRSRMLLLAPPGKARERVLAKLVEEGIAASRIEFTDRLPRPEYLKLYHRIDLGLDPLPYNGHTTSLDAFWMGVPTITLVSKKTAFGRAGWSQLCNLGLKELAAETPEQYVALAAQLAGDLPRLEELRGTLRQRMQQSPLMDGKRFARHMEHAYRQMWRRWCALAKPAKKNRRGR
jgi:predicted O-linked N-acetylglucosamine transferase (SPINDLY family)